MAKQTFTTGQVLTAAQMTSLQQTAMGGGSPSTKTASYVLVAADAGTVIQMNAAGSTTITVNTALFSAGDSVQIQNIGAGVCTITAGTATVNTAGSLALSQWEGGFLYFTSASSAIFFDVVQSSGMTNPMTTAGDTIYGGASGTPTRLAIGTANQILRVNSGATAPEWATVSSGGMTLLSTTTLSGSTTTTASISGTYNTLVAVIYGVSNASNSIVKCLPNASAGNCYGARITQPGNAIAQFANSDIFITNDTIYANDANNSCAIYFHNFQTTTPVSFSVAGGYRDATSNNQTGVGSWGQWLGGAAITSLQFTNTAGSFTAGTVLLYGVK